MKLLLLLLFPILLFASNWTSPSKLESKQAFQLKQECERVTHEECFDLGSNQFDIYSVQNVSVDDISKPIYDKKDTQPCATAEVCQTDFESKVCSLQDYYAILNLDLMQTYCVKLIGYTQKLVPRILLDSGKQTAYNTAQAELLQKKTLNDSIAYALSKIECGKRVIAHLLVRNSTKSLTPVQVSSLNVTYSQVKDLLETGSLETARQAIDAVVPDGTVVTAGDKTALLETLDGCK